jgi:superoxide oxidase
MNDADRTAGLRVAVAHAPFATQGRSALAQPRRDTDRYDRIARAFHWIFAVTIIYVSVAGYALSRIGSRPIHDFVSRLNMSLATILILLFPLRVLWKFKRVEPKPLAGVSAMQRRIAHGVHGVMYLVIFLVLASGFLMVPHGYAFFGWFEVRTPFEKGPLTDALYVLHRGGCALLAGLVGLHVLAVIKHQFVSRNNVLRRML